MIHFRTGRRLLVCLLLFFAFTPEGRAADPPLSRQLDDVIRPVCINKMTDRYIAGAVVSVVKDGKTVYAAGFGRREVFREVPVDAETTIFRIGSITKVLTGIAVMQLVDSGRISLDDDVNRHLRSLQVDATFAEPVRVRRLLTHTAGFDQLGYGRHADGAGAALAPAEFLYGNLVRIRPPGELAVYDTYGITLAGALVEDVSGMSYEAYLSRHIFAPLGMKRTGITVPAKFQEDVAVGYGFAGEWEAMEWEYMNTAPASSVNSTATDMARLMVAILEKSRVLSVEATREMLTVQHRNHERLPGFGLTFWEDTRRGVPAMSHGGSMEGFGALIYLVPSEGLGIFVACNQESAVLPNAVVDAVLNAMIPDRLQDSPPMPRRTDADLSRFAGEYRNAMRNHTRTDRGGWIAKPVTVTVSPQGDAIVFADKPAWPVGDLLFQREDGALVAFAADASGAIVRLLSGQDVYDRSATVTR